MPQCHGCNGKRWVDSVYKGPTICPICKGTGHIADGGLSPSPVRIVTENKPIPISTIMQPDFKCRLFIKGGQDKVVQIPREVPKIERENAWAMTNGFYKDGNLYYVSIFTAGENGVILKNGFADRGRFIPKVLSFKVSQEKQYPVSNLGVRMGVSDYAQQFSLTHRYVAILDRIFYIKKEFHDIRGIELWKDMCNNGVFDIWEPIAPYHRLTGFFDLEKGGQKVITRPQILLLRVFELNNPLIVKHRPTFTDLITGSSAGLPLTLKRPLIPYDVNDRLYRDFKGKYTFSDISNLIKNTLVKFGQMDEELVNDTSQIEMRV